MTTKKFIIYVILILFLTITFDQATKYFAYIYLFKQNEIIIKEEEKLIGYV